MAPWPTLTFGKLWKMSHKKMRSHESGANKRPWNLLMFLLVDVFLFDSPPLGSGDEHTNASEIVKEAAP